MEKKKGMQKLSLDELEKSSGGLIVEVNGNYWAVSEDGAYFAPFECTDVGRAVDKARALGWNTKIISKEDFEKQFGGPFEPFGPKI